MAGLGQKLSSLVKAVDDPYVLAYAYTHLGIGVPNDASSGGFRARVEALRSQVLNSWLRGRTFQDRVKQEQNERVREQKEIVALENGERRLALELFQRSTLNLVIHRLSTEKPASLRTRVLDRDPVIRFLAVRAIGGRRIHLESDLIAALHDSDPTMREAAHSALIRLARGTDFGPIPGASQTGITRSIEKWRHWLALQQDHSSAPIVRGDAIAAKSDQTDPDQAMRAILGHTSRALQTAPPEVARLCDELVKAKGDEQSTVLARLREAKGVEHTDALALAIPRLSMGASQRQAREALAQRLSRMKATTLRDKMQEDDVEVRRAAARACALKKATEHLPDLLQLLDDPEMAVVQSARQALKELTGRDFGPAEEAGRRGRADAAAAWRKWWQEQQTEQK